MNTEELIRKMNEELMQKKAAVFSEKTYSDEPIIRTASQLKSQSPSNYSQMRRIYFNSFRNGYSAERVFVEQGRLMEDVQDDFPFDGSFSAYFPTYQQMSDKQLRGYFSWRTRVRRGDIRESSASFALVYMFELLNQIGVSDAQDGFYRLYEFYREYSRFAPELHRYVPLWLTDYVAYYGLEPEKFSPYLDLSFERDVDILENCKSVSGKALCEAICRLSAYDFTASPFYKAYSSEYSFALCTAFREFSQKYGKNSSASFTEKIFGRMSEIPVEPFYLAVFYNDRKTPDKTVELAKSLVYTFKDGNCLCRKYRGKSGRGKSEELGRYVKYTESVLREVFSYEKQLAEAPPLKTFAAVARSGAQKALEQHRKRLETEKRSFVDSNLLEGIIQSADKTRDKLITQEEIQEEQSSVVPEKQVPAVEIADEVKENTRENVSENSCSLPLEEGEKEFVFCLLSQGDITSLAKERHIKISLLCDSINEKLYDIFYDTVIDFDGDAPTLNPDVIDMLNDSFKL